MRPLRVHFFQHAPFEGPGCITTWVERHGHIPSFTRWYAQDPLPVQQEIDMLIILGGPMGVYETGRYPWLNAEKKFIRETIENNKKVLGICLGAQLIAAAMGANVYPNREKEIGWFPVYPTAFDHSGECIRRVLKSHPVVFHWHGDTFDLPPGAVNHAYSEACLHQFFSLGANVTGIQFHFEVTSDSLAAMIKEGAAELVPGKAVQSAAQILGNLSVLPSGNKTMHRLLEDITTG